MKSLSGAEEERELLLNQHYPVATNGERDGVSYFGYVPTCTKVLFCLPSIGFYFTKFMKTSYMKAFYTDDYPQTSLSVIALFTVVAPLISVVWSPFFAGWTDNCKSGMGRRRPFLLVVAFVVSIVAVLSFIPPQLGPVGTGIWWGVCHTLFVVFCQSMHAIPYDSLAADLTPDFEERTGIFSLIEIANVIGILGGAVVPAFVVFGPDCSLSPCTGCISYGVLALVGGLLFYTLPMMGLVSKIRERPAQEAVSGDVSIAQSMIEALCNRPFRYLIVSDIIEGVGGNLPMAVLPYMVKWVIGWKSIEAAGLTSGLMFSILAGVHLFVRIPFTIVWRWFANRFGKYRAFIVFNLVFALQHMCFLSIGEGDIGLSIALAATWGMVYAGHWLLKDIMTTVVDYDEFRRGERREASYFMLLDYIPMVMEIPSEAVPFLLMCYFGYSVTHVESNIDCSLDPSGHANTTHSVVEKQSAGVVWTLRLSFSVLPAVVGFLGTFVLLGFPIRTEEQHNQIMQGIERHRQGQSSLDPVTGRMIEPIVMESNGARLVAGRLLSETTYNSLAHFFPGELRRAHTAGNLRVLQVTPAISIVFLVLIAGVGVYVVIAGFPDLVVGECSMSPIGLCMVGFSLVLIWLQSTRLLRVCDLVNDNVPMEDLAAMLTLHDPAVGGGTGYEESESEIED